MNAQQLINRYLYGKPLQRDERAALARQLKGAHNASKAISMAKAEAAKACHDWKPAEPTVGWVAICYVKYKQVWRVLRDDAIVVAYHTETEARRHGARLAVDVNAEWRGKIANPEA
jgi:hypothetical protein